MMLAICDPSFAHFLFPGLLQLKNTPSNTLQTCEYGSDTRTAVANIYILWLSTTAHHHVLSKNSWQEKNFRFTEH